MYSVNTVCRYDGICWNDWRSKHLNAESYRENPKNDNTDFTIEIGIKNHGKPAATVYVTVHFWNFDDDWDTEATSEIYNMPSFESDREFNDFLYENNIMQYIKDEFDFWCGISRGDILDSVYDAVKHELHYYVY